MTVFDWRKHRLGTPRPCNHCGRPALLRDAAGKPCHKVCAETHHAHELARWGNTA